MFFISFIFLFQGVVDCARVLAKDGILGGFYRVNLLILTILKSCHSEYTTYFYLYFKSMYYRVSARSGKSGKNQGNLVWEKNIREKLETW